MKTRWKVLLVLVAVASFAVALSYPIQRWMSDRNAEQTMEQVLAVRNAALQNQQALPEASEPMETMTPKTDEEDADTPAPAAQATAAGADAPDSLKTQAPDVTDAPGQENKPDAVATVLLSTDRPQPTATEQAAPVSHTAEPRPMTAATEPKPAATLPAEAPEPSVTEQTKPDATDDAEATEALEATEAPTPTATPTPTPTPEPTPTPTPSPTPTPTVNRFERTGALAYTQKEKQSLDVERILPVYRELYEMNHDMVGWLTIPETNIDYPVVQREDSKYYLSHDFLGNENDNGQIILDTACDPYTPSYNLTISGHNMRNNQMFSRLDDYRNKGHWEKHRFVLFDTLMERKQYVVMAAFYAADYDVNERGFRYNVDIRYSVDFSQWLKEVRNYQLYDTGIDAEFGDEFLTLTTCNRTRRRNGRFVVICRRIREGEAF